MPLMNMIDNMSGYGLEYFGVELQPSIVSIEKW